MRLGIERSLLKINPGGMVKRFICLCLIFVSGCIDPVSFKFDGQVAHLVVEGNFTDKPGLNYVRLSVSQPYTLPYNKFEEDATVYMFI